ncbi:MAG: flagellar motor protein MotB [Blastocatellia bacterium]|nr:MAG: flagellar motor protein MotB [Blastocatellia bacterium]
MNEPMKQAGVQDALDPSSAVSTSNDDETMAELRTLLLGPAEKQIADVHARLTDPNRQLEEVVHVLPAAISVRSRRDGQLADALAPTVTSAIHESVRKDPQPIADAIFPIIGPAIRKAISAALSGMTQSFNQTLAYSVSVKGLKWRLEALRTGRSFAEVVLLHTLLYRVEQVFLIHRETGLLLQHVSAPGSQMQDADMVSGMLTAIQDFVHDSFSTAKGDELQTLQVGELTVWVERGPLAVLAGVIRGNAPHELREVFQQTLERIHLQFGTALSEFKGDASPFDSTRSLLEDCLQAHYDSQPKASDKPAKLTPLNVIVSLLVIAALVLGFFWLRGRWRWDNFIEQLRNEPGIVVAETGTRDGKYYLSGLRDPLARDPAVLMQEAKVDPNKVLSRWEPFQALTPDFVLARSKRLLNTPNTVKLSLKDGVLNAEGFASHDWVIEARRGSRFLPGVNGFRDDRLLDLNRVEDPLLMFVLDSAELVPGQSEKFDALVHDIERLQAQAEAMQKNVTLEIYGHTDESGTEERNATLAAERAQTVASELQGRLPRWTNVTVRAVASKEQLRNEVTEADRATNRSVTFKVIATDAQ